MNAIRDIEGPCRRKGLPQEKKEDPEIGKAGTLREEPALIFSIRKSFFEKNLWGGEWYEAEHEFNALRGRGG